MVSQVAALPMGGRATVGMAPNERAAMSAKKPTMNQGTSLPTFSFGFGAPSAAGQRRAVMTERTSTTGPSIKHPHQLHQRPHLGGQGR